MNLGTKINLVLALVTVVVLTIAFSIIVRIEANTTKNQVLNGAETASEIFHKEIERMFKQVRDQEVRLQNTVDDLSLIDGVLNVNVATVDNIYFASTDHALIGKKANTNSMLIFDKIRKRIEVPDVRVERNQFLELTRYIPINLVYEDDLSEIVSIIEVGVNTRSKSANDITQAEKLLQAITTSIQETARSFIVTRNDDIKAVQAITDRVTLLGKINEDDKFGFYHDVFVFDSRLHVIANTGQNPDDFDSDEIRYRQYREDVLLGKKNEARYERVHENHDVLVLVNPITLLVDDKIKTVGLMETHILLSAYTERITELKLRMLSIGIIFTIVLVSVLAVILKREVVAPIAKYSIIARKISDGDLSQTVEHTSNDEIGQFGEVFDSMVRSLRELDKLKSDFISVAAHQLRTPLSGVKWVLKLLLDGDLGTINEDQKGMLKRGYDTNEKMIQLVNDLLNVSRIENGKFGLTFEKNNFLKLLNTLMENTVLPSKERNIEVRLENRAGEIPEFFFDPEKLLIALQNIVDNAMKYTFPGGTVIISVSRQGDYVEVKVSDTGVGIPKADTAKLFSKFFRASNVIHLQTDGSGLGLFIVKNIIVSHGGQIWVDSVEGKGTTFTIVIPLIEGLPANIAQNVEMGSTGDGTEVTTT